MNSALPLHRIDDLTDPAVNRISNMSVEEARARVARGVPADVAAISGSFALVARDGDAVRMARSLDRPLRYFLAKETAGPSLVVSDRIDAILEHLRARGLSAQFHPTYTRMVPAHHVLELRLVGCPDPSPTYSRFFAPASAALAAGPRRDRRRLCRRSRRRGGRVARAPRAGGAASASVSREASTAARSSSRRTTRCAAWRSRSAG